jgi:hypothetical protein
MTPRVCVCCGESMRPGGNALSRNPNLCASCSSLVDGLDIIPMPDLKPPAGDKALVAAGPAWQAVPERAER